MLNLNENDFSSPLPIAQNQQPIYNAGARPVRSLPTGQTPVYANSMYSQQQQQPILDYENNKRNESHAYASTQNAFQTPLIPFGERKKYMAIFLFGMFIFLLTLTILILGWQLQTKTCHAADWNFIAEETLLIIDAIVSIIVLLVVMPLCLFFARFLQWKEAMGISLILWLFFEIVFFVFEMVVFSHIEPTCANQPLRSAIFFLLLFQKFFIVVFILQNTLHLLIHALF